MTTTTQISVAHYWPGEGYGIPIIFDTMEKAESYAQKCMTDRYWLAGKYRMHIICTTRVVVEYAPDTLPAPPSRAGDAGDV